MKTLSYGLLPSLLLGGLALYLGSLFPLIGSSVLALSLGILLNNSLNIPQTWRPGLTWSGKYLLQYAIIILGFTLSLGQVSQVGLSSLRISLLTIGLAFGVAWGLGRLLKLPNPLTILIGFGTAICGGSAIAAASPILEAEEQDIALAMSTIFFFNLLAVLLFPFLGHVLHLTDTQFGLWAGTAVNDTSSVVAAAYSYSQEAGDYGTVVKLARALMIVPACLIMALVRSYGRKGQKKISLGKIIPWFILGFLLTSLWSSLGLFPNHLIPVAKKVSQFLMAAALVGIGSKVSLSQFKSAGAKPLLLGLLTWLAISLASLLLLKTFP